MQSQHEDLHARGVLLEVVDALLSDESLLDHTKERLANAAGQLGAQRPDEERRWRDTASPPDGGPHDTKHYSSCAVHNMPAFPAGPCDCGGVPSIDEIADGHPTIAKSA